MYLEKESATLELKERLTDSFLKTVSAYANYGDGCVLFGVADDGTVLGVSNPKELRLKIENKINDCISPLPEYTLREKVFEGSVIVELAVKRGWDTPYTYQGSAYRRSDTSTVRVERQEFRRLSIDGSGLSFDQLLSTEKNLAFNVLERALKQAIGISKFDQDTLRTLGLIRNNSYTKGAELLADVNQNAQSKTTIIRFGRTISEFMDRANYEYQSLLNQYEGALTMFDKWYQPYEAVVGFERVKRIQIPREAFREAVANAILHRRFDINGAVQVSMYEDRIEVLSPGGLPEGISETAFLYSRLSLPRNLTIAEVFHRLRIIEKFGTGIDRIRGEYANQANQPQFQITDSYINVVLPVIDYDARPNKATLEEQIMLLLSKEGPKSRAEIELATGYKRSWILNELKGLVKEGKLETVGSGRYTRYQLK
ncbi:MAG: ATP-binding protein [Christensenellales bacterium]|jgi:ATP-dependent DNA helicase RecG